MMLGIQILGDLTYVRVYIYIYSTHILNRKEDFFHGMSAICFHFPGLRRRLVARRYAMTGKYNIVIGCSLVLAIRYYNFS